MKSLKEQFAQELGSFPQREEPNALLTEDIVSALLEPWSGEQYSELMAIVSMLEGINLLTQTFHWKTGGNSFFGDHTLYQRIYEGLDAQIDAVGEKAVGLGSARLANSEHIMQGMDTFLMFVRSNNMVTQGAGSMTEALVRRAKYAITLFVETTEKYIAILDKKGYLTRGLDNLLSGILDQHEGYIYLLKQRQETSV